VTGFSSPAVLAVTRHPLKRRKRERLRRPHARSDDNLRCCSATTPKLRGLSQRLISWASRYARVELKGHIGVVVIGWDWGDLEMGEIFRLLSYGAAFCTGR
jgi:hypothetical protein